MHTLTLHPQSRTFCQATGSSDPISPFFLHHLSRLQHIPCRRDQIARACCPHRRTTRPSLNPSTIHRPFNADHPSRFQASRPPLHRFAAVEPVPLPLAPHRRAPSSRTISSMTSKITITMMKRPVITILACSLPPTTARIAPTCFERLSYQGHPRTQLAKSRPLRLLRR